MSALHQIHRRGSHVVAQIIEAELVVRTKGYITGIRLTACVAVRFMLVDTIDSQSVEHIQRSHPLGVTLGEVIVHRNDMHAFMRQRVEEHRQGCHEGLTFTRCHLGNLSLMQHHAAEELHIVVHHIPGYLVAACHPVVVVDSVVAINLDEVVPRVSCHVAVALGSGNDDRLALGKTPCRGLDDGECLGQYFHQYDLVLLFYLLLQVINLLIDFFAFVNLKRLDRCAELSYLRFLRCHRCGDLIHQHLRTGAELIVAERINLGIDRLDLVYVRLNLTHVFLRFVAEQFGNKFDYIHSCIQYLR